MTTINGIDRLTAMANGEKCDRIPVFCNIFDQGASELGMSIRSYYSRGEYVAEAQLKMREKFGYDNVWSLFYVGKEVELLGDQQVLFSDDGPPNIQQPIIKSYDDIEKLQIPDDIMTHPGFEQQLQCLDILKREVGGKYAIVAYISSTMTLPALLMGMEQWFELLLTGPKDIRDQLLDKCFDYFVKEVQAYRAAGADTIVYSNPFASSDIVSMKFFMEQSLPWIEKELAAVGPEGLIFYCGMARFNRMIPAVLDRTEFGTFYLSPLDDVAEAKRLIADRGVTCGVINDTKLISWSKKEIRANVRQIIEAGMSGGKFAFGGSATLFHTPEENIRTMLEAAYEYGSIYPEDQQ